MSIGEVLDRLRAEFPEVTISKLRFLEAEGLVEPQRTPAGYRKYAVADLARLRFVLSAQRDHYLPLRVIREQLAALDRGEPAHSSARPPLQPVDAPATPSEPTLLSRAELVDRSGVSEAMLAELEEHGLVKARGGRFDGDALTVARVAAQLAGYGLQVRHLRGYRAAADREVGLLTQLVAPLARQSTPGGQARAAEAVRELTALSQQLHAALVRGGLRDTLGQ
jgi:DNA-binding transcriptional MerR regulator